MEWVDIIDPTEDDLLQVSQSYGLRRPTFDEATRRSARPTLRRFEDHAYLVAFSGKLAEIDVWIGPTWLVTVRHHDPDGHEWDPTNATDRFERYSEGREQMTAGDLLVTILDELVDGYFDTIDAMEEGLEELEDRIFGEGLDTESEIQRELFSVRRQLLALRRVVMPLREVLASMSRSDVSWIKGEAVTRCRDTHDKLLRAVDLVDDMRELIGNAVDAHLAVMSNNMNLVMKKLTAWGAIVFGATLIAGIYGMNFDHMPELHKTWGYPGALGLMLLLSVVLYRMFRRRDWL